MTQTGVVARLAVRELWISFRLFVLIAAFVVAGAVVALVPVPLADALGRLALGLGVATLVAAAVAAWSLAEERRTGRAGWLVGRSLSRAGLLAGWFTACAIVSLAGLVAAAILGWLAASSVSVRLEPAAYAALMLAAGASVLAAVGLGLLTGSLLPPAAAAGAAAATGLALGLVAWLTPADPTLVPGGAFAALAALVEPGESAAPGMRTTGVGLASAAFLLVAARAAIERAEL